MPWPESLLVVDDQQDVRHSVVKLLADLDMAPSLVLEASDAAAAIALYNEHRPQLTLVDVVLFGSSGFDVLRHIRQQDEEAVVLMMTSFPQFDYAMEAIRGRTDHFLVKPLTARALETALMDVVNHKSRRTGAMPKNRAFYIRQLDRVLRGEEGLANLEKACREVGIEELPGSRLMMSLVAAPLAPEPEELTRALSALGGKGVSWRQKDGTVALVTAFSAGRGEQEAHLLTQALKECAPGFSAGTSTAARETGLMELYRRASFALDYARERRLEGLPIRYERLDLGRILLTRCHGALMAAYDLGEAEQLQEALDEWIILLRQNGALASAREMINEMFALEGLPLLEAGQGVEGAGLFAAVEAHFRAWRQAGKLPPSALRMAALRRYLLENNGALDHEALSSLTALSYGYLSELFRQSRGQSLNEYAKALRLRRVAELLAGTACRAYEVARLTGFEGNKHFYADFQKVYGQTPVQYHETHYGERAEAP